MSASPVVLPITTLVFVIRESISVPFSPSSLASPASLRTLFFCVTIEKASPKPEGSGVFPRPSHSVQLPVVSA
jgi:hypothetical protein